LPSLYEGFGLPVLEAMKYGCPVVISKVSSLPEAGGDAAIYFDPQDTEDISEKIDKVLLSDELRKGMIKKGYEQIKKFSWDNTAIEVLKVIEGVK
jgi:glycosyltransferase involved in cell wall biosynthesis